MKQDFSKKKVGDKMWSIQLGECYIVEIDFNMNMDFPIICENELGRKRTYTLKGCYEENDEAQSLFESNPFENQFQERVMEVSFDGKEWEKRVVFAQKKGQFIAWSYAETIEEAKKITTTARWSYTREIQEEKKKVILELTDEQIESLKKQGILCQN